MAIATLKNKNRTIEILLVEDNYGDALLTKKAFEKVTQKTNIVVAEDGEKAMAMLNKEGEHKDAVMPDLVLLDINLPKLNGKEVLGKMKQNASLKHIPVVILTSSSAEMDVIKSYHLHANAYVVKPADLSEFALIVSGIEQFWFNLVVLPGAQEIKASA